MKDVKFESVCGGEAPVFVTSHAKKKSLAKVACDSEDGEFNGGLSSDEGESSMHIASPKKPKKSGQVKRKEMSSETAQPKAKKTKLDKGLLKFENFACYLIRVNVPNVNAGTCISCLYCNVLIPKQF